MAFNHESWLEEFRQKVVTTDRGSAFTHATRVLSRLDKGLIIETGCVRQVDDWDGAGCSTLVWDWIVTQSKKQICAKSIDINPNHVKLANELAPHVDTHCIDSIAWLRANRELLAECSLLYLDSMDHDPPYYSSELHAVGELAAAYDSLPKGCMVMVDDCNPDGTGKHHLVKKFFERAGVQPEIQGKVFIWRKP